MSTSSFTIAPIVEGHGEYVAVPVLLRRLGSEIAPGTALRVARPIRRSRDKLLRAGELEKDVELAAELAEEPGAILILVDSEGECPAELGSSISARARAARPDKRVVVVLAHQEYEAWFLAAAESISGKRGLKSPLAAPVDPEAVRGAKEWLRSNMTPGRRYSEPADQPALTALFNLNQARACHSFDRLYRTVATLLGR